MGNDHDHNTSVKNIGKAFWVQFFLLLAEIVASALTGSFSILSNAAHDLGDSLTIAFAYFLQKKATTKAGSSFTYGLKRLSLLSSLLVGIVISTSSILIIIEAFPRMFSPHEVEWKGMLGFSIIGILMNGYMARKLGHGHTHNEKTLSWHFIEDMAGWISVLVSSLIIAFTKAYWIDSLFAILVALFVLYNVARNLFKTGGIFLQEAPDKEIVDSVKIELLKISEIKELHDLHLWSLDGDSHVASLHIVTDFEPQFYDVLKVKVREVFEKLGKYHLTIEVEHSSTVCVDNCQTHLHS